MDMAVHAPLIAYLAPPASLVLAGAEAGRPEPPARAGWHCGWSLQLCSLQFF